MADLGRKIRVAETDEPIKAPNFTPSKKETVVVTPERETVKVGGANRM